MTKIATLFTILTLTLHSATFNVATTPELRTALETAATNGEDDTIVLADGTYKTTDDGGGTFIYFSNEDNNLTLIGSNGANVRLNGDYTHKIIDAIFAVNGKTLILNSLTIENALDEYAVKSSQGIEVNNCIFSDNNSSGFRSWSEAIVKNSHFINNIKYGFVVDESTAYAQVKIYDSIFNNNGYYGVKTHYYANTYITNSIFSNNGSGAIFSTGLNITNSLFVNNGIYIDDRGSTVDINNLYNSIFLLGTKKITGTTQSITTFNNNYIDESSIDTVSFKLSNIFDGVTLGFTDEANGDYNLTAVSDLIDAGTTTITGITLPTTDLNSNVRVVGASIDIGPYEFSTTKPTIDALTYNGTAKELNQLTFTVDYTLDSGRSIDTIEYDYLNNGAWTTDNTHTFDTSGTYTVDVKVTDSAGEFSTTSLNLTIAPLPFADMTDEQKLVKAIDAAYYDEILAIMEAKQASSNASGVTSGENNVVLNPNTYGLFTQTDINNSIVLAKQYVLNNLEEYNLTTASVCSVQVADTNTTATTVGIATGENNVKSSPSNYGLFTSSDINNTLATGITTGKDMVIDNPSSYGLITSAELNASSSVTLATGIESGKQYVKDNLSEFELTTIALMNSAVNEANTTGYTLGATEKETSVLATPSVYGLVSQDELNSSVSDAISTGLTQGKQYVQDNLSEFDLISKPSIEVTPDTITNLDTGWNLTSTPFEITDLTVFNDAAIVWIYNSETLSWSAYSADATMAQAIADATTINTITSIPAGSGVWVLK